MLGSRSRLLRLTVDQPPVVVPLNAICDLGRGKSLKAESYEADLGNEGRQSLTRVFDPNALAG